MALKDIVLAAQRRALMAKEQEVRAHRRALEAHQRAAKLHHSLGQATEAAPERRFTVQVQQRLQTAIAEGRDASRRRYPVPPRRPVLTSTVVGTRRGQQLVTHRCYPQPEKTTLVQGPPYQAGFGALRSYG